TNSDKNGYKPRGRKPGRRTDYMNDPAVIARRAKALSRPAAECLGSADYILAQLMLPRHSAEPVLLPAPTGSKD
ncbi:MAG: hypothetical protein AAAC49_21145, partial [Rhizobium leguminosarum]